MKREISYYFGRQNYDKVLKELIDNKFEVDGISVEHDGIKSKKEGSQSVLGHLDAGSEHVYIYLRDGMNEVDISERSRLLKLLDDF